MSTADTATIVRSQTTHEWECTVCGPEDVEMTLDGGEIVIYCETCDSAITAR